MQKQTPTPNGERNHLANYLARVRRQATKRGLKIRKDWSGGFNLITTNTVPPRALAGLEHVSLSEIEAAVCTPLPPPRPARIAMGRLRGAAKERARGLRDREEINRQAHHQGRGAMTDTAAVTDRTKLKNKIASLDMEICEKKYELAALQEEIAALEAEQFDLLNEFEIGDEEN
jgi:hypothetical protein